MADVSRQPGVRGTTIAALATNRMIVRDNGDAWDRALDLTGKPARDLSLAEREELLSSVFDADWHDQIFVHARYHERFAKSMRRA